MGSKRWWASIATILFLVIVTDVLFLHVLFPMKEAARQREEHDRAIEHSAAVSAEAAATTPNAKVAPPTPGSSGEAVINNFREKVSACLGVTTPTSNPTELAESLLRQASAPPELQNENWRIGLPNGQEERWLLATKDGEKSSALIWRRFDVDAEGLPVDDPKSTRPLKDLAADRSFIASRGEVLFHLRTEAVNLPVGRSALISWADDSVREMQLFLGDKTLSCRYMDCDCR